MSSANNAKTRTWETGYRNLVKPENLKQTIRLGDMRIECVDVIWEMSDL